MNKTELNQYASLMTTCFLKDPGVAAQLAGLERAELLLTLQNESQIEAFDQKGAVRTLPDGKGLLIGYSSRELPDEELLKVLQQSSWQVYQTASQQELLIMQENVIPIIAITVHNWHTKYYEGEIFELLVAAVEPALKGSGALRTLLAPVLEDCEAKHIPITMQTHNPENVPIFAHFGFQLMETCTCDATPLTCYCMMKR